MVRSVLNITRVPTTTSRLHYSTYDVGCVLNTLHCTSTVAAIDPACTGRVRAPRFNRNLSNILHRHSCTLRNVLGNVSITNFSPTASGHVTTGCAISSHTNGTIYGTGLRRRLNLRIHSSHPLVIVIAHLAHRGNVSLIVCTLSHVLSKNIRITILNANSHSCRSNLHCFRSGCPNAVTTHVRFSPTLSRQVCTTTSVFLVPSGFRPYNLSRVVTVHCNALPVIHRANNLGSAIVPCGRFANRNANFSFDGFGNSRVNSTIFHTTHLF